jgi:hypothetical protein
MVKVARSGVVPFGVFEAGCRSKPSWMSLRRHQAVLPHLSAGSHAKKAKPVTLTPIAFKQRLNGSQQRLNV